MGFLNISDSHKLWCGVQMRTFILLNSTELYCMFIVWGISFQSVDLAKLISFTDERPVGSGAKLDSESRRYEEGDFTICLDEYINQ